ncbi:uncharacterized protein EV420DRAFT_1187144 [Desarmillaria tabescens]|uniref:HNH nuclease domain-containing protein n=1 Tax=Armillaria tabescens TaxID=1929756 RepID=A0AA39T3T1_ARMTA|nr:uncharacterized protein EV420DRAFT_1187144 [Desarmillaria tabescens]KAK0462431.1 hypothetical protein EV420DRAFT_1187144 [Desarmillaria tabescens]
MPEPLPRNPFRPSSDEHIAYESCLCLEALGSWGSVAGNEVIFKFSPEVAARVLGYALIHTPTEGMVKEICSCDGEGEVLVGLGYLYVVCVIEMFKDPKLKVKGSVSTPHNPGPSFQGARFSQPTTSSSDAKNLALARDNYRCILSGNVDINSFDDGLTTVNEAAGEGMRSTVLGHIVFGPSTADYTVGLTDVVRRKLAWVTSAAAVIKRFTNVDFQSEGESDIHRAENTFTVTPDFHHAFDELRVSLRPIEDDNVRLLPFSLPSFLTYIQ